MGEGVQETFDFLKGNSAIVIENSQFAKGILGFSSKTADLLREPFRREEGEEGRECRNLHVFDGGFEGGLGRGVISLIRDGKKVRNIKYRGRV